MPEMKDDIEGSRHFFPAPQLTWGELIQLSAQTTEDYIRDKLRQRSHRSMFLRFL